MLAGPWDSCQPHSPELGKQGWQEGGKASIPAPPQSLQARLGSSPGEIRQHLMFREGLPGSVRPSCPTAAVSLMSLASRQTLLPRGAAPGQQPELPPCPSQPFPCPEGQLRPQEGLGVTPG